MTTSDEKIASVGSIVQEKASVIWNAANSLSGVYKPHEYGLVILPMCVIKRLHDCLKDTQEDVLIKNAELTKKGITVVDPFLTSITGFPFYNTSGFTWEELPTDPHGIEENFENFILGFSHNIQEILDAMGFLNQLGQLIRTGILYQVVKDFGTEKADMSPEAVSTVTMGYIFENLIQRFSESYDEQAGAHFTSRDIIYLMCDLLIVKDRERFGDDKFRDIYDMTMGTSQMLTCMEERLKQIDSTYNPMCFGQEINRFTFSIAQAERLIRLESLQGYTGQLENICLGNTLTNDQFSGKFYHYIISNPPFGIDWKVEEKFVEAEHKKGSEGRFAPGLPSKSDGQMLFLLNGLAKLNQEKGRMAIIQNGSSLFTGDAGSGPSEIRKYIIENDWLEAIVQLPTDSFYNTGIATYVWIVTKNKAEDRKGKVQLIDASHCYEARRKSIGKKRVDITGACRDLIVKAYCACETNVEYKNGGLVCKSKVLRNEELGYHKVTIERPMRVRIDIEPFLEGRKKIENKVLMALMALPPDTPMDDWDAFAEASCLPQKILKKLFFILAHKDPSAKPIAGMPDPELRDSELIPLTEEIEAYFEREVKPFKPDAWIDEDSIKVGYEIPFTKLFYEYTKVEPSKDIANRISTTEDEIRKELDALFGEAGE